MSDKRSIFLSVIWDKARPFEAEIRTEIAKDFKILAETEVLWPRKSFIVKLADFYERSDWFCWWNKERKCGCGIFKVIVFEDESPEWGMSANAYGREMMMDLRVNRMKRICRRLTGHRNRFHSSLNAEETEHESMSLFGVPIADWLEERARWRIPSADELERLFHSGELEKLGEGSRRICYRIPGTELCVKCYRDEATAPNASVAKEIRAYRHDGRRNACCQEHRYYNELKARLPPYVFAAFPEVVERIYLPSCGWVLVESIIRNADGTPCEPFSRTYRAADAGTKAKLLKEFWLLLGSFVAYAVRFYDTQNIVVQHLEDGMFRLRVVDFEPVDRTLIPIDSFCPAMVRHKVLRRAKRYLAEHCGVKARYKGLSPRLRREWDRLIATKGAELGLTDCRAFLEHKVASDIFYKARYRGRPCIVKCSSRAPYSIRNEYEMLRRMFSCDSAVCAEPLALWCSPDGKKAFVVIEFLPGPTLTEICLIPHLAERYAAVAAGDFERMAKVLQRTGIVHGDMWTADNYLMGNDGHLRLTDFQFAVDSSVGCRDPWLISHPKYRFAVLSCRLDADCANWNDVEALCHYLRRLQPTTDTENPSLQRLEAVARLANYRISLSWHHKWLLRAYAVSLLVQSFVARHYAVHSKVNALNRRYGRLQSLLSSNAQKIDNKSQNMSKLGGADICPLTSPRLGHCLCSIEEGHPHVSVIVPVYKVEKYLRQCVDSILRQSLCAIEVIIVDDGSPDGCPAICDEYASCDSRVKVLHKKNGGLSSARNAGLELASAPYVMFCDGDDYLSPYACEELYAAIMESDADVACCNVELLWENECIVAKKYREKLQRYFSLPKNGTRTIGKFEFAHLAVTAPAKLFKRMILTTESIRFPDGYYHEDEVFHRLYMNVAKRIVYVDKKLYVYRQRPSSIMTSADADFRVRRDMDYFRGYEIVAEKLLDKTRLAVLRTMCERRYKGLVKSYCESQQADAIGDAFRHAMKVFESLEKGQIHE